MAPDPETCSHERELASSNGRRVCLICDLELHPADDPKTAARRALDAARQATAKAAKENDDHA